MFRRLSEPLPLSEASLLALRPALNAPVLNVGFLPVGPARAAIVAFGEEWGGIGLALGIRSNESGQVAVFRNQESIEPDVAVGTALEPVLAEAERMGFLFDEDMVASAQDGRGRSQALALWARLMGELELPPASRAAPAEPAANESIRVPAEAGRSDPLPPARPNTPESPAPEHGKANADLPPTHAPGANGSAGDGELVLDDRLPELDLGLEGVVVAGSDAPASPPIDVTEATQPLIKESGDGTRRRASDPSPSPTPEPVEPKKPSPVAAATPAQPKLSKFRHADEAQAVNDELVDGVSGGNQLGRIPLVRVRRERDGAKRVSALTRLLSSF